MNYDAIYTFAAMTMTFIGAVVGAWNNNSLYFFLFLILGWGWPVLLIAIPMIGFVYLFIKGIQYIRSLVDKDFEFTWDLG